MQLNLIGLQTEAGLFFISQVTVNTDDVGNIWKIRVDIHGNPLGPPIQLTSDPRFEKKPSWSGDGQTIFFHSEIEGHFDPLEEEFDIWSISASGEERRKLTPDTGMGVDVSFGNGTGLAYGRFGTGPIKAH